VKSASCCWRSPRRARRSERGRRRPNRNPLGGREVRRGGRQALRLDELRRMPFGRGDGVCRAESSDGRWRYGSADSLILGQSRRAASGMPAFGAAPAGAHLEARHVPAVPAGSESGPYQAW
jgi:hypothetical protein